jgi:hypothetical protein
MSSTPGIKTIMITAIIRSPANHRAEAGWTTSPRSQPEDKIRINRDQQAGRSPWSAQRRHQLAPALAQAGIGWR